MGKELKITLVPPEVFLEEDFLDPSRYFVVSATGDRMYFHTSDRLKAQEICDSEFGKGKYKIRTDKIAKSSGEISCRGSMNSKSHAGAKLVSIRNSQGRGL